MNYRLITRIPTVTEYLDLTNAVGWGNSSSQAAVKAGLEASVFAVVAEADGVTIAQGRVVGDGSIYLYIQDVIVLPDWQGNGIGRSIMEEIMSFVRSAPDQAFVGLFSSEGNADFYKQFGFAERPLGRPGMYLQHG